MLPTIELTTLHGETWPLSRFQGQVLLVVNTASACGFTPQLAALQALHERYAAQGLVILGQPCNQFGRQEPGSASDIQAFCLSHYGVSFPLLQKAEVNGPHTTALFQWLKQARPGVLGCPRIHWNFTKFLVNREGQVLQRFAPWVRPARLAPMIEANLHRNP